MPDKDGFFVPATPKHILPALQAADPQPGEKYVDIGSGDGRRVAVGGGVLGLEAHGYERSAQRHELAEAGLQEVVEQGALSETGAANVHLHHEDFFAADISDVDIFSYFDGSGAPIP